MRWVRPTRGELLLAAVLTTFGVLSVLAVDPGAGSGVRHDADAAALALAVLATAPIALRRTSPFGVLAATCAGIVAASALGYAVAAAGLGPTFAATSAAFLTNRRGAIAAGVTFAASATVAATVKALVTVSARTTARPRL